MHVGGGDRDPVDQGFLQVEIVPIRVSGWRGPLVDLEQVDTVPGNVFFGESA
jgi:hypothetical protein